jgi:hypothetical protein
MILSLLSEYRIRISYLSDNLNSGNLGSRVRINKSIIDLFINIIWNNLTSNYRVALNKELRLPVHLIHGLRRSTSIMRSRIWRQATSYYDEIRTESRCRSTANMFMRTGYCNTIMHQMEMRSVSSWFSGVNKFNSRVPRKRSFQFWNFSHWNFCLFESRVFVFSALWAIKTEIQ